MSITIITPPAEEPVTLAQLKAQCGVDDSSSDELLGSLLVTARQHAESRLQRGLITQTRALRLDRFPDCITLREGLVQSITSIAYADVDGQEQTLPVDAYQADIHSDPARIAPAYDSVWPATREQMNAVTVTYVCGYTDAAAVPSVIKSAILLIAADLYANREASIVGATYVETPVVANLLADSVSYAS